MGATPRVRVPARAAVAVGAALLLTACGDDGAPIDDDMLDASNVTVTGCEIDAVTGGRSPGGAPSAPPDSRDVAATMDEAIATTGAVSSAVVNHYSLLDMSGDETGVEIASVFAADGTGRVSADIWGIDEGMAVLGCSDGDSAWLHVDHPAAVAELPPDVAWVTAPYPQMVGAELMVGLEDAWVVLPILRGLDRAEDVGTVEVAGVEVRLLRGQVDYQAARAEASAEEQAALARTLAVAPENAQVTAEVGLDADGVIRLLVVEMESVDGAPSGESSLSYRLEVADVDPAVPAPREPAANDTVPLVNVPQLIEVLNVD